MKKLKLRVDIIATLSIVNPNMKPIINNSVETKDFQDLHVVQLVCSSPIDAAEVGEARPIKQVYFCANIQTKVCFFVLIVDGIVIRRSGILSDALQYFNEMVPVATCSFLPPSFPGRNPDLVLPVVP